MFRLIFFLSLTTLTTQAQDNNLEQTAFNYFVNEILAKEYADVTRIYYCGQTESESSIAGPFAKCFQLDSSFNQIFYQKKNTKSEKLIIESGAFHQFKKSAKTRSKHLNLRIYRAVTTGDMVYVYIKVFKENQFVDHYLIKLSSNKVVDACHVNETI